MTTPDVGLLQSVYLTEPETVSNTVHSPAVINNSSLIPEVQDRLAIALPEADEGSNFIHVNNAEFLAAVFHKVPAGAFVAVCTKAGDPTTGAWMAKRADKFVITLPASGNNYFNYSSVKIPSDGEFNVRVENFAAYHCVVCDDIGTKTPLAPFDGITPSWKLETSPGNYQVGFILAEPITDLAVVTQLQKAIIAKGLSDPGTTGSSHYVRLPVAINGKPKYATAGGKPFRCQLVEWRPDVRFTVQRIVESLVLELLPVQPVVNISIPARSKQQLPGAEYPDADANKVADACQQIGAFRDTKGADQAEPLWRDCLGVVGHCVDGEIISQEWSSGHADYDETATEQKLAYRLKMPPTTCAQFKKLNAAGCEGCAQKCKSPITLGWPAGSTEEFSIIDEPDIAGSAPVTTQLRPLAAMQQQFFLINMAGKFWVGDKRILAVGNGTANQLVLSDRGNGKLLMQRALRAQFTLIDEMAAEIINAFWVSPQTTCFDGVEFNPSGTSKNSLNLWVGPTITAKAGKWPLIKSFLLAVICDGDVVAYLYLLGFIAHALQRPGEKPGVFIILLGGQGIGKGRFAHIFSLIWGATFLRVQNIDAVTGNFNGSLERAFIVVMDEALFVGDRRASDALKSLVTEPTIFLNEKHQPARQMKSFHRFIALSNAEHFKSTDRDDRRDFVLRVSDKHKNDFPYFNALHHEMENGGIAAMVHDLQAMDLSDFNVRRRPNTQELLTQKLQSLGPTAEWWFQTLREGVVEGDKWPSFISTKTCMDAIGEMFGNKLFKKPTQMSFARDLKKLCPGAVSAQKKSPGQFVPRVRGYNLPSLAEARAEFEAYIGDAIAWEQWNA